jgi:succinate dehydrogenase/fumarate reductase flavoprotein subunit
VVLTCGGYEFSQEMLAYFNIPGLSEFIFPWGNPGNTGDGIRMALGVGADLWHMCCLEWGPFCAKVPSKKFGFAVGAGLEDASIGNFIFVNKYGKRFMNERKSPVHRKGDLELHSSCEAPRPPGGEFCSIFINPLITPSRIF